MPDAVRRIDEHRQMRELPNQGGIRTFSGRVNESRDAVFVANISHFLHRNFAALGGVSVRRT